jgi:hypothetical protein
MAKNKPRDLITVREARELMGVGPRKMADLISRGMLPHWTKPLDARLKLVSRADVRNLMERVDKAA